MKVCFIGGTGTISSAITRALVNKGEEVWLINRGKSSSEFDGKVHQIIADVSDEADVAAKLEGMSFDVVCDFIGFVPAQVERDYRLFAGKTKQYMYISSAVLVNPIVPANARIQKPQLHVAAHLLRTQQPALDFLIVNYRNVTTR